MLPNYVIENVVLELRPLAAIRTFEPPYSFNNFVANGCMLQKTTTIEDFSAFGTGVALIDILLLLLDNRIFVRSVPFVQLVVDILLPLFLDDRIFVRRVPFVLLVIDILFLLFLDDRVFVRRVPFVR